MQRGPRDISARGTVIVASLVIAAAATVGAACGGDDDDDRGSLASSSTSSSSGRSSASSSTGGLSSSSSSSSSGATDDGGAHTEAEVARILVAVNQGEIDAGNAVQSRATSAAVKDFAAMMISEHGAALQRANLVFQQLAITPVESALSRQLQTESATLVTQLGSLTGPDLDRRYMETQVVVHMGVLAVIDGNLLPNATTAGLRGELATTRTAVQAHLTLAQAVLAALRDAGAPDAGDSGLRDAGDGGDAGDAGDGGT